MFKLPKGYRFRTTWLGKLVLQKLITVDCSGPYDIGRNTADIWVDCAVSDLFTEI